MRKEPIDLRRCSVLELAERMELAIRLAVDAAHRRDPGASARAVESSVLQFMRRLGPAELAQFLTDPTAANGPPADAWDPPLTRE